MLCVQFLFHITTTWIYVISHVCFIESSQLLVDYHVCFVESSQLLVDNHNNNNSSGNNNNNIIIVMAWKAQFKIFTISSLHWELSPTCTFKWPGRNYVQIMCNTSIVHHMPHAVCHLVQRDSSAIKFDRVWIAFIIALFYWLNHSCLAKTCSTAHFLHNSLFWPDSFIPAMLIGAIDLNNFIPLSVGCKVGGKQKLFVHTSQTVRKKFDVG